MVRRLLASRPALTLFIAIIGWQLSSPREAHAQPAGSGLIEVGAKKQLFLDDYLIASSTNIVRTIHPAEKSKSNPVIRSTEPWEEQLNVIYGSVIRDGQQYRMWYKNGLGVSVASSDDGVHWVKPQLDFVKVNGAKTNILFRRSDETHGSENLPYYQELFGVFKDDRESDPARRYKMGFLSIDWYYKGPQEGRHRKGQKRGLGIATSPDGMNWKLVESFASEGIVDGATHWMHDPVLNKFILYGRSQKMPPEIVAAAIQRLGLTTAPRSSYRSDPQTLLLFYKEKTYHVDLPTGKVMIESNVPRRVLYEMNQLHLNRAKHAWTYIADIYGIALILLAITGLFVLKGKLGITGRGGWLTALGALIPVGYWFVFLR